MLYRMHIDIASQPVTFFSWQQGNRQYFLGLTFKWWVLSKETPSVILKSLVWSSRKLKSRPPAHQVSTLPLDHQVHSHVLYYMSYCIGGTNYSCWPCHKHQLITKSLNYNHKGLKDYKILKNCHIQHITLVIMWHLQSVWQTCFDKKEGIAHLP